MFSLFLIAGLSAQAQTKTHFRVLENGVEVQNTVCHTAITELNLDLYRYTDVRRQIAIDGTAYVIELYSGQELWNTYQKQISPNNRPMAQDAHPHLQVVLSGNRLKIQTQ